MEKRTSELDGAHQFRVLIVGVGDTGLELARRLAAGWNVTLVDLSPSRLEEIRGESTPEVASFRLVQGDGTSRLVLEGAGAAMADLAVVVASPDEVGLEVCRVLRREYPTLRVVALVRQRRNLAPFIDLGVDAFPDSEAEAAALIARVDRGNRIAQQVGLGEGEVMETEVLPASSAVGKTVGSFRAKRWLVAAVYRRQQLVVPHGETVLQGGDRLLLVGDPRILPSVAAFLRSGVSEFPLQFGAGIGLPLVPGAEAVHEELRYVFEGSEAQFVTFLAPGERKGEPVREVARVSRGDEVPRVEAPSFRWVRSLGLDDRQTDVGLTILPPQPLPLLARLGLRETLLSHRIRRLMAPVLIPRGSAPYKRILFCVPGVSLDGAAATLALDVSRRFQLPVALATPRPPEFVSGHGHAERIEQLGQAFTDLSTHYRIRYEWLQPTGNPVAGLLSLIQQGDLLVVGLPARERNSVTRPSVALHLLHRASCSVLVLPQRDEG